MEVSNTSLPDANSFLDPTVVRTTGKSVLGQSDFLKLLTTQLSNQDPMKPMEDTQFVAQMAQFTSLEQMSTLSQNFSTYASKQNLITAQQYLGKTVTINGDDGIVTGQVDGVTLQNDEPMIVVGGKNYDPSDITDIRQAAAAAATTPVTPTPVPAAS